MLYSHRPFCGIQDNAIVIVKTQLITEVSHTLQNYNWGVLRAFTT